MNLTTGSLMAGVFALCTALFWGVYGPLLQKGHQYMGTEGRMRPFICVGIAYLLVAIVAPIVVMYTMGVDRGEGLFHGWTVSGILWSILAGSVGALGAFTLLMAIGAGGPPSTIYIMPIVFGCAPVVSTLTSMYFNNTFNKMSPFFAAGLILVAAGAVTILITAPRQKPHSPGSSHSAKTAPAKAPFTEPKPAESAPDGEVSKPEAS